MAKDGEEQGADEGSLDLDAMLRKAAREKLTKEEYRAQKISFVMGMMPEDCKMTRKEVEELIDSRYG